MAITSGDAYVDTDLGTDDVSHGGSAGSGACASLNYLFNNILGNYTGALTIHCKGSAADTVANLPYLFASAANPLTIKVDQADRHNGEWNTAKYRLYATPSAGLSVLYAGDNYVTIEGLQIGFAAPSDSSDRQCLVLPVFGPYVLKNCIFYMDTSAGAYSIGKAISANSTSAYVSVKIINCAIMTTNLRESTYGILEYGSGTGPVGIYNCTIKNFAIGIAQNAEPVTAYNCGFVNCTALHSGTVDHTTTCSEVTPTFAAGKEFHLDSTDTTWKDQGTSDPGSGLYSDDIDGVARTGTWDIGADEYAGGASPNWTRCEYELS
jgi:hypothetical protein